MKRSNIVFFIIFLSLGLCCTNLFDTRTPEEPEPTSGQPTSGNSLQNNADSVLAKIKLSFSSQNPQLYQECFADPFRTGTVFLFTPEQDEAFRLINWALSDEEKYFSNFVNSDQLIKAELRDSDILRFEISPDTFKTEFTYLITAEFRTKIERYQGRSILGMLRANNDQLWYIYEWVDLRAGESESDSTWSTLKANYR